MTRQDRGDLQPAGWALMIVFTLPLAALADEPPVPKPAAKAQRSAADPKRLAEADRLLGEALRKSAQGRFREATPLVRQHVDICKEVLGERDSKYVRGLMLLANALQVQGDTAAAKPLYERSLNLVKEVLGERDPAYVIGLEMFAGMLLIREEYPLAEQRYRQALAARKAVSGEKSAEYANNLRSLATVLRRQGRYAEAKSLFERALAIEKEILGARNPSYATTLVGLASLLEDQGDYAGARLRYEEALVTLQAAVGQSHQYYAVVLNNLAGLLSKQGDYRGANLRLEQALAIIKDVFGEQSPIYAKYLNNLATVLQSQGDLLGARRLLERALAISQEAQGERRASHALYLNNLAELLMEQGDYVAARPLLEQSLALTKEVLGERHPDYVTTLGNLARLRYEQKEYLGARRLYEQALSLGQEILGRHHPDYAFLLNGLAGVLCEQKEYLGARRLYEQALAIRKEVLGEHHPNYASSLNNLAYVLESQGDLAGAKPLLEQALAIEKDVLGEHHPDYANCLTNLVLLLQAEGEVTEARRQAELALDRIETFVAQTLPALPERERLELLSSSRGHLALTIALATDRPDRDTPTYRHLLAWKGLATAAGGRPAADRPDLIAELNRVRAQLKAGYYARVPADQADRHAQDLRELVQRRTQLESRLAEAAGWKARFPAPEEVAAVLPADAALLDLFRYRHALFDPRGGLRVEARFVGFVVRPGGPPRRVDLGPADPLDEALHAWRAQIRRPQGDPEDLGRALARRVWAPLAQHLDGVRTVLVAPDGDLNFLPWGALPDGRPGSFLVERYAIGIVPSGRQLVALAQAPPLAPGGGLLAVGGVDYGAGDAGPQARPVAVPPAAPRSLPAASTTRLDFAALPGTRSEAEAVGELFRRLRRGEPRTLSGAGATKDRLATALAGPGFLHLATHGYFAPPELRSALAPDPQATALRPWEGMGLREVAGWYPGLLSGLVWANANRPRTDPVTGALDVGSGVMTAEDVAGLDLKGCTLAVLSACETGLGRTAGGEGVLGLQRAFHQAGCRTVVASLWKVDDEATGVLMERFYHNLWGKPHPPLEALRQAQLSLVADPELGGRDNPWLWAGWTLSGDPGGLTRRDPPRKPGRPREVPAIKPPE
jgi:CHAT domain-containing protein/tetratricopeptide (TPR) repeat protein